MRVARIFCQGALLSLLGFTGWSAPSSGQGAERASCQPMHVPVTVASVPGARLRGELCLPAGRPPRTVLLLVHGASYGHAYWDWPQDPSRYSYVRAALAAGYATFNVDRLGAGQSTRPLSAQVTLTNGAEALHDAITQLRSGAMGGPEFSRVIWVGHSFGSIYAWIEASMYRDVDAFVLTGIAHTFKNSTFGSGGDDFYPASQDPKFAGSGLDPGYLTTRPGTRGKLFYYAPGADPSVIALDEELKDTATATELAEGLPLVESPPPETAPSRAIVVPTFIVLGDNDNLVCGPPDGLDCTGEVIAAAESPYYSREAGLEVAVIPNTGHNLQLHLSARDSTTEILEWIRNTLGGKPEQHGPVSEWRKSARIWRDSPLRERPADTILRNYCCSFDREV